MHGRSLVAFTVNSTSEKGGIEAGRDSLIVR